MAITEASLYSPIATMSEKGHRRHEHRPLWRTCRWDSGLWMWSSPFALSWSLSLSPSSTSSLSLLPSSRFFLCFILIFSHLVVTIHTEKPRNLQNTRNSAAIGASNGHGIFFKDSPFGTSAELDRKPKINKSSSSVRDTFSSIEGSGTGANNPNEDDEDDGDDIDNGSGRPDPDDPAPKPAESTSTTTTSTTTTTTTTPSTTTTSTTPSTTTTTTTTPSPSSSTTLDPGRIDDEDEESSGVEGSGILTDLQQGSSGNHPSVLPSSTTTTSGIDFSSTDSSSITITSSTTTTTTTESPYYIDFVHSNTSESPQATEFPDDPIDDGVTDTEEPPIKRPPHASFFARPGILAAVIGGTVVGLLCAIILVMFIVYRMRKKDEGSYPLEAHTFRGNKVKECRYP